MSALTAAVIGLRMGGGHANIYNNLSEYKLAGLCDIDEAVAQEASAKYGGVPYYADYKKMLDEIKPDVVCVATPNTLHCEMTLEAAARDSTKGIYCEKPIAVNMREARAMRDACEAKNIPLCIGHQRRMSAPYITMRDAIVNGLIGEVYLIRGICAGDFLSDGTHTVDSLMYLNGDHPAEWVLGQIYRGPFASEEEQKENRYAYNGKRFGHNTERGAISNIMFSNGVRAETVTGDQMLMKGRWYQDIEVFGSKGRLWRNNDQSEPPVMINTTGEWVNLPFSVEDEKNYGLKAAHGLFAKTVCSGAKHPMDMETAMKGFDIVMGVYESARLNARVGFPLAQEEFPLDLMLKERGEF
ncbi:MAG: Gfo/Idh/MocA family oxidoreductase [Defluviitaleaceae bacterium]|nr:Gfo/Idh/MocA family oxidoreductase [Defluviitaleaceae bacterium]